MENCSAVMPKMKHLAFVKLTFQPLAFHLNKVIRETMSVCGDINYVCVYSDIKITSVNSLSLSSLPPGGG